MSAYQVFNYLISQTNICCGYSKEPSQGDGSFKHQRTSDSLNEGLPIKMTREKFQRKKNL